MPPHALRLVVISVSHYCEKASWALERYGVAYELEAHAPGFHRPAVNGAGSKTGTVPCLALPEGGCVADSTDILRWVDARAPPSAPRLFPADKADEVAALCTRFDTGVGVHARTWAYSQLLDEPLLFSALTQLAPSLERTLYAWGLWPLMRRLMRAGMGITPQAGAAALTALREELASVSELLADGRRFLAGDAFTAADIAFVCLAAPALGIAYGTIPPHDAAPYPQAFRDAAAELAATRAGAFALRVWAEERKRVVVAAETAAQ